MSDQDTPNYEAEASKLGWSPKEKWRGDPDNWVDAKTYVERGQQFMPLLKAHNTRLQQELGKANSEVARLQGLVESTQASVEELKKFHREDTRQKLEDQKKQLLTQLKAAKKDDDVDAEVEISDQLQRVNTALLQDASHKEKEGEKDKDKGGAGPAAKTSAADDATQDPAFLNWMQRNPWFGQDRRKTLLAQAVATDLAAQPNRKFGQAFWDALDAELEDAGIGGGQATSKVNAGGRGSGGGGGSSGGKSFKDLPAEARAVCERQAASLVGEGKAFKDMAAWQKHYAEIYFADQE